MYIFKTSGKTFNNVIKYQKHAYKIPLKNWDPGEIVLVSKNKADCNRQEKQIQYIMKIDSITPSGPEVISKYWPGFGNKWNYLIHCTDTKHLVQPFNLEDILDAQQCKGYHGIMTFKRLETRDEALVIEYINKFGTY